MSADYPVPSSAAVSAVMQGNRRRDTAPELRVRSLLHRRGLRYRVDLPVQLGKGRVRPDIVFTRDRLAIFIDGCFWHACPQHGTAPQRNVGYWRVKLARNVERDREVDRQLEQAGWTVLRVWEHVPPASALEMILTSRLALRAAQDQTEVPESCLQSTPESTAGFATLKDNARKRRRGAGE